MSPGNRKQMDGSQMKGAAVFQIRVRGYLGPEWSDWFDRMTITNEPDGITILTGLVRDQAALNGLLNNVFDLNLELVSVMRLPSCESDST